MRIFMHDGFIRVAAATPVIQVADCPGNADHIIQLIQEAADRDVQLIVFPELVLTGYTCSDLFLSRTLQQGAYHALLTIVRATAHLPIVSLVGLPLAVGSSLYNVAAVIQQGRILGFVPKRHIPNYSEFYEARHFQPGPLLSTVRPGDGQAEIPLGSQLLFQCLENPDFTLAVEVCEDLWVPQSPSISHALAGATVIANLSASDELIGKADYRRLLVQSHSGRLACAYLYADAGEGESTTDLVFAGHNLIYENGRRLAESSLFAHGLIQADLDVQALASERRRQNTYASADPAGHQVIYFSQPQHTLDVQRPVTPHPFVPADKADLALRCEEILTLQVQGLKKRLAHTRSRSAVIGLSGGLDSTLALLVTARAFTALGLPMSGITTVTMPGFGTTDRTYYNSLHLARNLETTLREIPIRDSVMRHFADIGHPADLHDVTYENCQARERTQILMDIANQTGGLVIGTGDLSELALGWATYNGDHMSMYAVNCSVPKTLVRHLVRHAAGQSASQGEDHLSQVLLDILDTPVSPELLPPKDGKIAQKTEHIVGPYELHDFFLYYLVRFSFRPAKILRLACLAFAGQYEEAVIRQWLTVFVKRFFAQQFKRSCLPDGPKVGSVTLSPRGDWRMPSDAVATLWLDELIIQSDEE
jgi:NAD+ synthase (glutamine-hydrolysing)